MKSHNKIATPHDVFTKANLVNVDRAKALTKSHHAKEIVALIDFDIFQNSSLDTNVLISKMPVVQFVWMIYSIPE